ncbi:methylmalonyl-CoA mutase subunit beta [Alteribacillus sp. HJP-4]|uniref:methylmalonyl-CoA mutase subunit beta n=1 Tax=Alteribacillus sp. HJP-4 TaxID=2775394 RepID=UPI0035CD12D6
MEQSTLHSLLKNICDFPVPSEQEWWETAEKSLKGKPADKALYTETDEDITLQALYRIKDREGLPFVESLPGQYPFIRGAKATPLPWKIVQEIHEQTPQAVNTEIKKGLKKGQQGVSLRWKDGVKQGVPPTENDKPEGSFFHCKKDAETILKDIDLDGVTLHIETGAHPEAIFSMWAAVLQEKEALQLVEGSLASDPLGEWLRTGRLYTKLDICFDQLARVTEWSRTKQSRLKTVLVSGEVYHNGGASAVEELAYTMAAGVSYLRALIERGLTVDQAAAAFQFTYSSGSQFFMEMAKFRAARALWANILSAFNVEENQRGMTIHARTSARTKTEYDPYVNMLRAVTEAFSAAAGGADSLHVSPFDEVFQRPIDFSNRIARNTQIILQEEAHIGRTLDTAGGSYFIERLTHELAEKAWGLFQEVEGRGGLEQDLREGKIQARIKQCRDEREEKVQTRKNVFIGVNKYPNLDEQRVSVTPDPDKKAVAAYVNAFKRENKKTTASKSYYASTDQAVSAVAKGVSVSDAAIAGGRREKPEIIEALHLHREAEPFEKLRKQAEAVKKRAKAPLSAFLLTLGPLAEHKPRTDFTTGFLQTGGFAITQAEGSDSVEEAVEKGAAATENIIVMCGSDTSYEEIGRAAIEKLKGSSPSKTLLLAGRLTKEEEADWKSVGLDEVIHAKSNVYKTLKWLHEKEGGPQHDDS